MNKTNRIHAFDWLRIFAFSILIFYHSAQPFDVFYNWHITNPERSSLLTSFSEIFENWRMHLLFFISGFGTYFALRTKKDTFIRDRLKRLGLPLLVGIAVICPPQVYIERIDSCNYDSTFFVFYIFDYFTKGIYAVQDCSSGNVTWNHLWFLFYLLLITVILTPLSKWITRLNKSSFVERCPSITIFIIFPIILVLGSVLLPLYPHQTNDLTDIGYFVRWTSLFLSGFLFAMWRQHLMPVVERNFYAITIFVITINFFSFKAFNYKLDYIYDSPVYNPSPVDFFMPILLFWGMILFLSSLFLRYLNKPSKIKEYLNNAVFPFYVLHQTVIVIIMYYLKNIEVIPLIKWAILSSLTIVLCWIFYYFLIKKLGKYRVWFGAK